MSVLDQTGGQPDLRSGSVRPAASRDEDEIRMRLRQLAGHIKLPGAGEAKTLATPHRLHDPWDTTSAEALTRVYEGETAVKPTQIGFQTAPVTHERAPTFVPTHAPTAASVDAIAALAVDRTWLEGRLTDIAVRVDDTLQRFDPAAGFTTLNARLDTLEADLGVALDDIVRRADIAGLGEIEHQITDLVQQFDGAKKQLMRLDSIEGQLTQLRSMVTTAAQKSGPNQLVDLKASDLVPHFEQLATAAAERTAEKFAVAATPSQATAGIDRLQTLLDGYISEHRREQVETTEMLGTMQEALIRLIDRIEDADHDDAQDAEAPARFFEVSDQRGEIPGRRLSDREAVDAQPIAASTLAPAAVDRRPARAPAAAPAVAAAAVASAVRQPRTVATTVAPATAELTDVQALAAEKARVAAERAALHAQRATDPRKTDARTVDDAAPKPARTRRVAPKESSPNVAKRGLMVAGAAAVLIGLSTATHWFVSSRIAAPVTAQIDDLTPAAPNVATPKPTAIVGRPTPVNSERQSVEPRVQPAAQQVPMPQIAPRPINEPGRLEPGRRDADAPNDGIMRPRSVPETVTDDLSQNTTPAPGQLRQNFGQTGGPQIAQASLQGIALEQPAVAPNPLELARRQMGMVPQEQAAHPQAVTAAARFQSEPPAEALPNMEPPRGGAVEMPPALIGPTSLRMAAQKGDPAAQFEVAARFAEGKGIKQDFPQAQIWYQRAAQKGFIPAQYRLATLMERGLGGTPDLPRAKVWYKRAADQGNVKAMHNLAVLSAGPQNANPDYATASKWFTDAAERGLSDSQYNLAVLYDNGLGVAKDPNQAYKWFALAARSGDKESIRRRDQLALTFTPDQAQAAELLVTGFRSRPTDLKANDPRAAAAAFAERQEQLATQAAQQQAQAPEPTAAPEPRKPTPKIVSRTVTKAN